MHHMNNLLQKVLILDGHQAIWVYRFGVDRFVTVTFGVTHRLYFNIFYEVRHDGGFDGVILSYAHVITPINIVIKITFISIY